MAEADEAEEASPSIVDDARRASLGLGALGLALRLWVGLSDHPIGETMFSDMSVYLARSKSFLDRAPDAWDTFTPIGFPFFLSLLARVFPGSTLTALAVVHALAGGATVVMSHGIALRAMKSPRAPALVGAIVAVHPALLLYSGLCLTETLSAFFVTLVAWVALRGRALDTRALVGLGVALGAAVAVRPNLLLFLPALYVWFRLGDPALAARRTGWLALGMAPLLLAACIHNSRIRGKPTGPASNGGLNFFLAHAPYNHVELDTPGKGKHFIAPIPNLLRYKDTYKTEVPFYEDAFYYREGLAILARDPYRLVVGLDNVLEGMGGGRQDFWPGWPRRERTLAATSRAFFWLGAVPAFVLVAALAWLRRHRRADEQAFVLLGLLCLCSVVTAYLFLGDPRVRVPFDALFVVLAVEAWRRARAFAAALREAPSAEGEP